MSTTRRILFICGTPPSSPDIHNEWGVPWLPAAKNLLKSFRITAPPLGAVTLATYLRKRGHNVQVKDWFHETVNPGPFEIIGISTTFMDFKDLARIAGKVKAENPGCRIIVGGPLYWSYSPSEILLNIPEVDYIVLGAGEETTIDLLEAMEKDENLENIKSIAFRKNGTVVQTQSREPFNPAQIAIPDWSLLNLKGRVPLLPIETARGCIYHCAYCSEVNYWGKPVRFRSIEPILEEVENDIQKFGITTFRWADSCFSGPAERCMKICDALTERFTSKGVPLKWAAFARVTNINRKLLEKMRASGCIALAIGMESGNEKILTRMNKHYSQEDIRRCVSEVRELGIIAHCNVVVGFPGETEETITSTIETLNLAQPDSYHCMQLFVAPNTTLSNSKIEFGIQGDKLVWRHETMSSRDVPAVMDRIVSSVKPSCLMVSGELVTVMLASMGYSSDDVRSLFRNLTSNQVKDRDLEMVKSITSLTFKTD